MRELNICKSISLILMCLCSFSAKIKAQECDENVYKSLQQTRISTFDKVTQGEDGVFTIKYPLDGVTYTFSDQNGHTYTYTHTTADTSVDINVGAIDTERLFSLKAQKGSCVYQTAFEYKITPQTALGIAIRVEHEWCNRTAALYYKVVGTGADNSKYNFYHKKNGESYATIPSPVTGVQSLKAGTYEVKAEPKPSSGAPAVAPRTAIKILDRTRAINFNLTYLPAKCASEGSGIRVTVTSGNSPLYYTLLDPVGNPIAGFPKQTSNVFTHVPAGNYKVRVEDFCAGSSGGTANTKDITVGNDVMDFTYTTLTGLYEHSCDYIAFYDLGIGGPNVRNVALAQNLPFPFTVKFDLKAPSGTVYTIERNINNYRDSALYLEHHYYSDNMYVPGRLTDQRIPKEEGEWEATATVTVCGVTKTLTSAKATLVDPFKNLIVKETTTNNTTACHRVHLQLQNKTNRAVPYLNMYVVVEQAPVGFNYEGAGFYKINSSNPLLHDKYLKLINNYNSDNPSQIVAPDFLSQGDTFRFRLVDAECSSRSELLDAVTITQSTAPEPPLIGIVNFESCKGVTATAAPYASMRITKAGGSEITQLKVTAYDGNPADLPFALPYTLTARDLVKQDTWMLYDLPAGKYSIEATNKCGATKTYTNLKLTGETYNFNWVEGCTPKLTGQITSDRDSRYHKAVFTVEYFDEASNTWRLAHSNSYHSLIPNRPINEEITYVKKGKFRLIRRVGSEGYGFDCETVLSEKEFKGDLEKPSVLGFGCTGGKYHIVVLPKGGTPPFKYELVSKAAPGQTNPTPIGIEQQGDNFFIDLSDSNLNTKYLFKVTDSCLRSDVVETTLGNLQAPTIVADKEFYCLGQQATLSIPDLGPSISIKWYRSDDMTTPKGVGRTLTLTLTSDDFTVGNTYIAVLEIPSKPAVQTCISRAIQPYQFNSKTSYPSFTLPTPLSTTICIDRYTVFDLKPLFRNMPTLSGGVTATITDKEGVIPVSNDYKINIGTYIKGEHTFVYTLWSPCQGKISSVEAKLTINRKITPTTKDRLKVCNSSVTMNELKTLILEGSPQVRALEPEFHWYLSESNAQAGTAELLGTYAISIAHGTTHTLYLRYTKKDYCVETIIPITVEGQTAVTAKTLTGTQCGLTKVSQLKPLVDPDDKENVIIYKNGEALADDALIEDNVGYTYAKRVYPCITAQASLTFPFDQRTSAQPEQVEVCSFRGNGIHATVGQVLDALRAKYVGKTIKLYMGDTDITNYRPNSNLNFIASDLTFTVQETSKCPSLRYKVTLQQAPFSTSAPLSLTICEDTTIAELTEKIEALGYTDVKIYRNTSLTAANDPIIWQSEPYYYRAQETGKCPSQLTPLTLTKETTNITPATARRFEVCLPQGHRPRVSDLKASIGGDVRIFTRIDSRNWRLQADNAWVSLTSAYFYTIREAGKCPSEKTPLIVAVTYKTPTPSAPNAGNFCQGKTIADLKDYIDNTVNGTIRVYASNTATTPLTDTTVLTTTTYYYSTEETGRCESDRRAITIVLVATPTPRPTYTYCAGTKVETLWDDIDNNDSDRSLKIYENASGGTALARNTVLRAGYYYVAESSSSSSLGNCETSRAQLKVVLQNPVAPTVTTPQQFCSGEGKTLADLSTATNLKWYTTSTGGTALVATTTLQSATYYASQVVGNCEGESRTPVVVSVTQTPDKPTFITTPESCAAPTQVIITNYQSGYTYWLNNNQLAVDPISHRITTLIRAGSYTIKAKNGSCESQASGVFRIKAQKTVPDAPTITLTAESCTAPTKAVIDNYESRQTYWYNGSQLTVDTTTHEITGLTPGTYIITTKNRNCESLGSASFVIKTPKTVPATPTVTESVAPTCTTIGVMKVSNYDNVSYTFIKSADNTEVTGVTVGTDGVISNLPVGKYKVKAKKDSCESVLSAEFELKDKLVTPQVPTLTLTAESCTAPTKAVIDNYVSGQTYWHNGNQLTVNTTTHELMGLAAGTYTITAKNGSCESGASSSFVIKAQKTVPATPAITESVAPTCTTIGVMKVSNYDNVSYTFIKSADNTEVTGVTVGTDGVISNLPVGKYKVKAKKDSCESVLSAEFELKDKLVTPQVPTLTLTAESCTAPTKAVIDNYVSGQTYWHNGNQLTVNTTTHELMGLAAGTYTITAKNGSCESGASSSFVIKAQKTVPATPAITESVAPTCTTIGVMKVSNYDNVSYTFIKSADNTEVTGVTVGTDGVISNLPVGKYKVKAKKDSCESVLSAEFELKDKLVTPQVPTLTLTAESCTAPTKAVIDNYVSGQTYWHNGSQLTVNTTTHELMGLAAGIYTITTKNGSCESGASDSFEIKPQKTATTITTAPAGATYQKGTEATPLTVVATGEGTLSYKWYKNTNYDISTAEEVGDNSPSYKPATDTVGTFYYWVKVTSTCGTVTSAIAEIKVIEGAPTIEANDDPDTTVRRGGEVEILSNDKVNGNPATPSDVDITITDDGGLTGIEVNAATGKLKIPTNAAPGTYQLTYQICVKGASSPCDTAKVKIIVEVPIRSLKAVDDDFGKIPNAVDYTTIATVFSSGVDTMEGVIGNLSPERDVILTPGAQPHANITMNANGSITVKRGTPKGTYSYEYTICQKDVPTNCDSAKVTFEVVEAHIFAKDDGIWEVGTEGALTPSILNNDIIGERVGVAPSEVTITKTNGKPVIDETKMVINEDGRISVLKNIPEGTYTYYYTITEKANIANSSSAVVTIKVVKFSAQDDEFELINDKTKENKTKSVLENDELNKKKNLSPVDDVILTKGEAKDGQRKPTTALTMNDDGTITIAPNTPDGVYTYTYTICKKSAPTECKSAEAVIKLLPALVAEDDDFSGNPINPLVREGIVGNVLDNDRYADGKALEYLDKVVIKMLDNQNSRAHIEPNGDVVIPQGAPAGEYTLTYNLCMKDYQTICDEAKVKIVILEDKPLVIHNGISANADGQNDGFTIENIEGYPKNNLKIFNRWGVLVYEKDGYTNSEPFDGNSNGRATINAGSKLPQGTYYYILEYQDTAEQTHTEKGWLYLKY
nr:gliding motility-associated C-terminal domain-containing protein [uncultured Capnocytophaga sp.]